MNPNTTEIRKDLLIKIEANSIAKINGIIAKKQDQYVSYVPSGQGIYNDHFSFLCKEHGTYILSGASVRLNEICPKCKTNHDKEIIDTYNTLTENEKIEILKERRPEYSFTNSMELDNTIRPECPDHGEFLTTPRKILAGDTCKWCDGITDTDGDTEYSLDRVSRLQERKDNIEITYENPLKIISRDGETTKELTLSSFLWSKDYSSYLDNLRNPSNWNSIFFKINLTDKSSKFQFSIVHVIYLNETWLQWYQEQISLNEDSIEVKRYTTEFIIDEWFHQLFYGKAKDTLSKKEHQFEYDIQYYDLSVQRRTELKAKQYYRHNENKLLILPTAITERIHYNLQEVGIRTYWSENRWDTTGTSIAMVRESIGFQQKTCPICSRPIKDPVVDHEHKKKIKGSGRVRDNICGLCNVFIAKTENNCKRYKIEIAELPEVLKNLSGYFSEQQYNIVHYTDKDKRPTIKKTEISKILKYWPVLFPKKKKPTAPKSGVLTKDWAQYKQALDNYLKNPYPPLGKLLYNKLVYECLQENKRITEFLLDPKGPKKDYPKLIEIPDYPKLKVRTSEISELLKKFNIQ